MDILHTADIAYVASGFGVGFLVGLTGAGGGSLMTPLLILLFGVHPATAVGTGLFYACATKAGGSGVHAFNRTIDWRIVARLATGSAPAAALTLLVLRSLGVESEKSGLVISKMLGIALVLTALSLIFRQTLLRAVASRTATRQTPADGATRNLTIATGAALGVLVTVSSVGAGALGMTALLALYPRQPLVRLVGSDIAHAVPLTLVAGVGHWAIGDIDFTLLFSLLLGLLPGITIASMLAPLAPERLLRLILAGVLILAAWRLFAWLKFSLTPASHFYNSKIMEIMDAVGRFSALAQESRLKIVRALISKGPSGIAAGALAEALDAPASTISFHLKELANAGLVLSRKEGRRVIYVADYAGIRELVDFLMADCCQGDPRLCGPYVIKEKAS